MTNDRFDRLLDSALKRHLQKPQNGQGGQGSQDDAAATARVLNRLASELPRQHMPLWRWPMVLLDWQFAPAWPRMAALAGCLALGFVIGIAGLDRGIDRTGANAGNLDFGSLVFEPETFSGERP
jgi:hypothetical protein